MWPSRYVTPGAARARFGDRVDRLAPYLLALDPPADRAVEALASLPPAAAHGVIARAIAGAPDVPGPLRALVDEAAAVPAWVDWARCDRGGAVLLRAGVLGGMVLGVKSLVYGYAAPAGNKPLTFSGRLYDMALVRLNETGKFVQAVVRPGGMRPGGEGFAITLKVRLMHAQVRRMLRASPRWRTDAWGEPINQHDMVATTLLFSGVVLLGLGQLGLAIDRDESDDYMHLWRWVGRVIGVDDALLPATYSEAVALGELIAATQGPPDDDSRALTRALLSAGERVGTPEERARARRMRPFAEGLCRALVGDPLADQLGVERNRWVHVVPAIRRAVATMELARKRSPRLERATVAMGERYWDRVVARGLGGANAEFGLPRELLGAAAAR